MLTMEVAIMSERGGRSYNEDACGYWHSDRQLCCVLADGAGGHGGGDIASRFIVEHVIQRLASQPASTGAELNAMLREANQALIDQRVPGTVRAQMHTTVVGLVIDFVDHRARWAHAGDSRLYWFRGGRVVERTRDHSVVQGLVDAGLLAEADLRKHPNRSELLSALGVVPADLAVSDSDIGGERHVAAGDVFLLCTDGVWEHMGDEELEASLQAAPSPAAWLSALEECVKEATRHHSSHDNFTALAVWTDTPPAAPS